MRTAARMRAIGARSWRLSSSWRRSASARDNSIVIVFGACVAVLHLLHTIKTNVLSFAPPRGTKRSCVELAIERDARYGESCC